MEILDKKFFVFITNLPDATVVLKKKSPRKIISCTVFLYFVVPELHNN